MKYNEEKSYSLRIQENRVICHVAQCEPCQGHPAWETFQGPLPVSTLDHPPPYKLQLAPKPRLKVQKSQMGPPQLLRSCGFSCSSASGVCPLVEQVDPRNHCGREGDVIQSLNAVHMG